MARQVRPKLSYKVSKLQCVAGKGTVKDMKECNKVLEFALQTSDEGLYFASDGFDLDEAVLCTITDASFANDTEEVNVVNEAGRSQHAVVTTAAMCRAVSRHLGTATGISGAIGREIAPC